MLIAGIKMKNAGMIARSLSLAALIYTFTLELIKTLKIYYNKNKPELFMMIHLTTAKAA